MDTHIVTSISGDIWNIYLIDDEDNVISDEESAAETDFDKKEMYIRKGDLTPKIIRHELFHAYFGYCYLANTNNIEISDIEEICCTLFSDRGEKMVEHSNEIFNKLVELKESLK